MQSVRWVSFCVAQAMSRSVLHFFPSCDNASAPYAANCTLSLFGPGLPRTSVMLEGGRLGHPDGLRLEDAFPVLKGEATGIFGLEVEISTPQPRLDVRSSACVVEIISQGLPVRFAPKRFGQTEVSETIRHLRSKGTKPETSKSQAKESTELAETPPAESVPLASHAIASGLAVRDAQQVPSILIVNGSSERCLGAVYSVAPFGTTASADTPLIKAELAPGATQELPLDEGLFRSVATQDLTFGRCSAMPISVECSRLDPSDTGKEELEGVGAFMVYREATSRRMVSVLAL